MLRLWLPPMWGAQLAAAPKQPWPTVMSPCSAATCSGCRRLSESLVHLGRHRPELRLGDGLQPLCAAAGGGGAPRSTCRGYRHGALKLGCRAQQPATLAPRTPGYRQDPRSKDNAWSKRLPPVSRGAGGAFRRHHLGRPSRIAEPWTTAHPVSAEHHGGLPTPRTHRRGVPRVVATWGEPAARSLPSTRTLPAARSRAPCPRHAGG